MKKNILIVPDAYTRMKSGAIVAREIARWLTDLGYRVSSFSPDVEKEDTKSLVHQYRCKPYRAIANHRTIEYLPAFRRVLDDEQIDAVFFVGSITNKNVCYFDECFKRGLKTMALVFMQDYFCMRQYANSLNNQCEKCISNPLSVFFCSNGIPGSHLFLKKVLFVETAYRIRKVMARLDAVIGSTQEQLAFYQRCGVSSDKCILLPLPFDRSRINPEDSIMGNYYMCIAQDRSEKGFQYIPEILKHCRESIKIVLAYDGKEKAQSAIAKYGFEKYIQTGQLVVEYDKQWNTGLYDLIARSRGVIIPSIWHSTTEYGLLEALGLRKPVFTFDISVHHEFIEDGVNGFKVPLGDTKSFAEALNKMHEDNFLYQKVSEGAYILYNQLTDESKWKMFFNEVF